MLNTDASQEGIVAVLSQRPGSGYCLCEWKHCVTRKELLSAVTFITDITCTMDWKCAINNFSGPRNGAL